MFVKFSPNVEPSTKSYNQALIVKDGLLQFVPMNTTETFIARGTVNLKRVQTLLGKIIEQELDLLAQLHSFKNLLQSAGVISKDEVEGQKQASNGENAGHSNSSKSTLNYNRRSIGDIFTPYSVTSIGDTANENYLKMNVNFDKIEATEKKLIHHQQTLQQNFESFQDSEIILKQKELYLEMNFFKQQSFNIFLFDLLQILKENTLDVDYQIVFTLLREQPMLCFVNF